MLSHTVTSDSTRCPNPANVLEQASHLDPPRQPSPSPPRSTERAARRSSHRSRAALPAPCRASRPEPQPRISTPSQPRPFACAASSTRPRHDLGLAHRADPHPRHPRVGRDRPALDLGPMAAIVHALELMMRGELNLRVISTPSSVRQMPSSAREMRARRAVW